MLTSQKVFSESELRSRCEITLENYCKTVIIEASTMVDMARKQILPAVGKYTASLAEAAIAKKSVSEELACGYEKSLIAKLSVLADRISIGIDELEEAVTSVKKNEDVISESAEIRDKVLGKMSLLRLACDEAETVTAAEYWPFPTYDKLLFGVK